MSLEHFVFAAWDERCASSRRYVRTVLGNVQRLQPEWALLHPHDGFMLACRERDRQWQRTVGTFVAVWGTLFEAIGDDPAPPRRWHAAPTDWASLIRRGAGWLADRAWGRYVGVTHCASSHRLCVFRDPTGALPCYLYRRNAVTFGASRFDDLVDAGVSGVSIDWRAVPPRLLYDAVQTRNTCLQGVSEVMPGECVEIVGERRSSTFFWTPAMHARSTGESVRRSAQRLRASVRAAVGAWEQEHDRLLHHLSGGLDSAIVLSCLDSPKVRCINYHATIGGDERAYARAAAARAGTPLMEMARHPEAVSLKPLASVRAPPNPTRQVINFAEKGPREIRLAETLRATAIFSGQGGDHVFFHGPADPAVADLMRDQGFSAALKLAARVAGCGKRSLPAVLARALGQAYLRIDGGPYSALRSTSAVLDVDADAIAQRAAMEHPWLARRLPPGRARQIFDLVDCCTTHDAVGRSRAIDVIHPLISQPIVECCLGLPPWRLVFDGRDRSLARLAFGRDIPNEIRTRYSKGDMTSFYHRVLATNSSFAREFLLDGLLVAEHIFSARKIERLLAPGELAIGRHATDLLLALAVEAWARHWARKIDDSAAASASAGFVAD